MALFSSVEESRKRRGKLADAMLMQSLDTSPVQHWTQGAARLAQALTGGYIAGDMEREDKARLKKLTDIIAGHPALSGQTTIPQPTVGQMADKWVATAPVTPVKETPIPSVGQRAAAWTGYTPSTWDEYRQPLRNAPVVTSPYGERTHPILGKKMMHEGVDLAAAPETPVYASAPGRILKMGEDPINGRFVVIQHNDGKTTSYSHLSGFGPFKEGDTITDPTNEIGYVGSTGRATGPHLHFGTRNQAGASSDPQPLLGQSVSPNAAGPRTPPAPQPPQPTAQPAASPAPAASGIPQATRDYIKALIDSGEPELIQMGVQILGQYTTPDKFGFQVAGDQLFRTNPRTGQAEPIAGVSKPVTLGADQRLVDPKTGATVVAPTQSQKPPAGYEWVDPTNPSKGLKAIPGGPATHLPGEVAGRIALAKNSLQNLENVRDFFKRMPVGNVGAMVQANLNMGDVGRAQRDVQGAVEVALRIMTGAAAPEPEVKRYTNLFMPLTTDTVETRMQKLNNLQRFLEQSIALATQGRGDITPAPAPPAGGWTTVAPNVRIRRVE